MLKLRVKSLDEVDEAFRTLYKKDGDGFVLETEDDGGAGGGDSPETKKKLKEFRDNNIALTKQVEGMQATLKQFEGVDPKKIKELTELSSRLDADEDSKLIKEGKIDDLIRKRMSTLSDQYEKNLKKLQDQIGEREASFNQVKGKLSNIVLDQQITKIVNETGVVKQGALTDILNRARGVFKVDDNDNLTTDATDEKMNPITPQGWAKRLVVEAPYFFDSAGGGGGGQGGRKGAAGNRKVISDDPMDVGQNLEAIANGTATTASAAMAGG